MKSTAPPNALATWHSMKNTAPPNTAAAWPSMKSTAPPDTAAAGRAGPPCKCTSRRALVARPPASAGSPAVRSVPLLFPRRLPDHVRLRRQEDRRHQEPARAAPHAARGGAHQRAGALGEVSLRRADARADPLLPQGSGRCPREGEVGGARAAAAGLLRADPRGERPGPGHAPLRRAARWR